MKTFFSVLFALLTVMAFDGKNAEANGTHLGEKIGKLPLAFTVNRGQVDSPVAFTTRGNGCSMFFTSSGTTFLLNRETEGSAAKRAAKQSYPFEDPRESHNQKIERDYFVLKLHFKGANSSPEIAGEDKL